MELSPRRTANGERRTAARSLSYELLGFGAASVLLLTCGCSKKSERNGDSERPLVLGEATVVPRRVIFDDSAEVDFSIPLLNRTGRPLTVLGCSSSCGCTNVRPSADVASADLDHPTMVAGKMKVPQSRGPAEVSVWVAVVVALDGKDVQVRQVVRVDRRPRLRFQSESVSVAHDSALGKSVQAAECVLEEWALPGTPFPDCEPLHVAGPATAEFVEEWQNAPDEAGYSVRRRRLRIAPAARAGAQRSWAEVVARIPPNGTAGVGEARLPVTVEHFQPVMIEPATLTLHAGGEPHQAVIWTTTGRGEIRGFEADPAITYAAKAEPEGRIAVELRLSRRSEGVGKPETLPFRFRVWDGAAEHVVNGSVLGIFRVR